MPSSKTLLRLAEQADRDADKLEAEAVKAREQARELRRLAESAPGTEELLHDDKQLATVNSMTPNHALAISKTQRGKDRKFRAAMHAAKFTQNSLAEALKISSASLTRYRDKRAVPRDVADKVKELTGFDGSWPGGIVE